jgi:hypothetical protein
MNKESEFKISEPVNYSARVTSQNYRLSFTLLELQQKGQVYMFICELSFRA